MPSSAPFSRTMPSKSKIKGNAYEVELVKEAKAMGLQAKRAWGSDGRSLGLHEGVDLVVEGQTIQAKRRKAIASYIRPDDNVDVQVLRQDYGVSYAVMPYTHYLQLLARAKEDKP